jgi:hypothetical protein
MKHLSSLTSRISRDVWILITTTAAAILILTVAIFKLLTAVGDTGYVIGFSLLALVYAIIFLTDRYFNRKLARANIDLSYAEAELAEWCLEDEPSQTPAES